MSIYSDLLDAVSKGKKFNIDLINKSLWIGKNQIIKDGEIVNKQDNIPEFINKYDLHEYNWDCELDEEPWSWVEFLYDEYKYSVPSKNENHRSYFKALPVDELTDADLTYNLDRIFMQAVLEGYILLGSLNYWIKWEYGDNWFWQGLDSDLVILRNWIE